MAIKGSKIHKPEIIRINLSTPFLVRSRCRECGSLPSIYYYIRNPILWFNPSRIKEGAYFLRKYVARFCMDYYLEDAPASYTGVTHLTYTPKMSYRFKLHKNRGVSAVNDFTEYLTCDCGGTTWSFYDRAAKWRPEIYHRKAKNKYPQKFEY